MSVEQVKEFLQKAREDDRLREKLGELQAGGSKTLDEDLVRLAAEVGFSFGVEDVWAFMREIREAAPR